MLWGGGNQKNYGQVERVINDMKGINRVICWCYWVGHYFRWGANRLLDRKELSKGRSKERVSPSRGFHTFKGFSVGTGLV